MGTQLIGDPTGVSGESPLDIGQAYIQIVNGDTVSLPTGTLVEIITPITSSTTSFSVKRSATTADFALLGVVAGQAIAVGAAGRATVEGVVLALFDGATTAGDVATQSTTTAGDCHDNGTTVVAGKTIGTVLQTIASAGSAYLYVHKV